MLRPFMLLTYVLTPRIPVRLFATFDGPAFHAMCGDARGKDGVVQLDGGTVKLYEPYKHVGKEPLTVRGGTIVGSGHSVFEVGGNRKGLLTIDDCIVLHKMAPEREEQSKLGAALFVRGKGSVKIVDSTVSSAAGFGVWLVQKANVTLTNVTLRECGRSSIVAFQKSQVTVEACRIVDGTPHGICARGDTVVKVLDSEITGAAVRAIYTYHSAKLSVTGGKVTGTKGGGRAAAIQCDALKDGDEGNVIIEGCWFEGNEGGDVSVTGNVIATVQDDDVVWREATDFANFADRERD